ncbi:MAG: hypothetical protein JO001_10550 [Alphaproteobacteria bacterium]|nr:hypothetical protein [Alphaproteobacteria bacterium]
MAIDAGGWGAARLPRELSRAGASVAVVCPTGNPLAATRFVERHFRLPALRSARTIAARLTAAVKEWQPQLIIPADEQVVAVLHRLVGRGAHPDGLDAATLALVATSLGRSKKSDAMLSRRRLLDFARRAGLRVLPDSVDLEVVTASADDSFATDWQQSRGAAGETVALCHKGIGTGVSTPSLAQRGRALIVQLTQWMRGERPSPRTTEIMRGTLATYCVAAWRGRVLAGFAALPEHTAAHRGAQPVVRICQHTELAKSVGSLVTALGASGLIAFDFVIEAGSGRGYLTAGHPCPTQFFHLGPRAGANLAAALVQASAGVAIHETAPELLAARFAQAWLHHDDAQAAQPDLDVPWDDPELLRQLRPRMRQQASEAVSQQGTRRSPTQQAPRDADADQRALAPG